LRHHDALTFRMDLFIDIFRKLMIWD